MAATYRPLPFSPDCHLTPEEALALHATGLAERWVSDRAATLFLWRRGEGIPSPSGGRMVRGSAERLRAVRESVADQWRGRSVSACLADRLHRGFWLAGVTTIQRRLAIGPSVFQSAK